MRKIALLITTLLVTILATTNSLAQSGTIITVAGGDWGFAGDGGPATASAAAFQQTKGVATDTMGDIFIGDMVNYRIRKVNYATGILTTIAGNGTAGFYGDGGPAVLAMIDPGWGYMGLAADYAGNCYLADQGNNRIRKTNYTSGIITTVAGNGSSGFSGDGGPATAAGLQQLSNLYVDAAGNIYFSTGNRIRKVDAATSIISTVCGGASGGFSGDGGAAVSASLSAPTALTGDVTGNLYICDDGNRRIRKINTSGIITTIAGNGGSGYSGNGGPATAATFGSLIGIGVDSAGNVAVYDQNMVIRQINVTTGRINNIAGSYSGSDPGLTTGTPANSAGINASQMCMDQHGTIYYSDANTVVNKIINTSNVINTLSVTDSLSTTACTLPATLRVGIKGTLTGTPAPTDSVTVSVDYGQYGTNSSRTYRLPYWLAATYGFGSAYSSLGGFTYTLPGTYTPSITFAAIDDCTDVVYAPTVTIGSNCASTISGIYLSSQTDSIYTLPCVFPAMVKFVVKGTIAGTPSAGDSVYIAYRYDNNDTTFQKHIVPFTLIGGTYNFSDTLTHPYAPGNYFPEVYAVTSSGHQNTGASSFQYLYIDDCTASGINVSLTDTAYLGTYCSLPFSDAFSLSGSLSGYADTCSLVKLYVNYGDGCDTTFSVPVYTDGHGYFNLGTSTISSYDLQHTYLIPGTYSATVTDTAGPFVNTSGSSVITLGTSCSPLTGTFYIDSNADCIYQPGEVLLGYWPYALINNTLGDTTYGWCDDSGRYALPLIDGYSYTIVADPTGYFGGLGTTLTTSCPVTGLYTTISVAGSSYIQDFAFSCAPPSAIDMSVSGWGWGFVPGDTGIVGIWSSNYTGYTCNTLTSTITLTLDPLLTYIGMWNGPAPTSVSGSTLTWVFSTVNDLFDFSANVKVSTSTTATMGAAVCNTIYVSPTSLTDPDLTNNTYPWCQPVLSAWDPNDKYVSPLGSGTQGYIPNGTPLSYLVHFQNTGTAAARNITVADTINTNLDLSTLTVIGSSAPVLVFHEPGNRVKFRFNDINLPDSNADRAGSNGYIAFNIMPKPALAPGTQITNIVGIYFDYNPAVITNTALNTINNVATITGSNTVCIGSVITLSNTTPGGTWSLSNSHASITGGLVTGISAGTVIVSYSVPGAPAMTTTVNVVGAPVAGNINGPASVCIGSGIVLANTASGGTWSATNSNATVAFGNVTGAALGLDTIVYSVSNACGLASAQMVVNVIPAGLCNTGFVNNTASSGKVEIYPNPTTGELTITADCTRYSTYTITNNIGQVLTQQQLQPGQTTVNVQSFAAGLYYITIRGNSGIVVQKFVKL
ncbi:hypothetical protein CJD36_001915 [Flavipsychrobacter stenotrophus]|uniref:Uncharacterized protein n=1 Tax=Flavipsychrobacter stenotrophus TaxID=2077091 RepID=A0A2S7T010_9BACT|nr:T9SS type A sorting domain-containing protein [Flavipsychrobacter stenotrophus]PQJ12529.1 hypothetical protein CJD36_001915 [Flavipsychrobacter stenotrophus]